MRVIYNSIYKVKFRHLMERKWGRLLRRLKQHNNIKQLQDEYDKVILKISHHSQNNYRRRSILRYNLRDIIQKVSECETNLKLWKADIYNKKYRKDFLDSLRKTVLLTCLDTIKETLEYLDLP